MRGGCRAPALARQRFLGEARTRRLYRIFDCGSYPGLVEASAGRSIHGELWQVNNKCLRVLDQMEGVDQGLYERRPIALVNPPDDRIVEAYFYLQSTNELRDCGTRWLNTDAPR